MTTQVLDKPAELKAPVSPAERTARRQALLEWIAVHALGVAAALFFVLPFVFVFLTSLMSDTQALSRDLIPHTWEWGNYKKVFDTPGFLTWWKNTLLYAGAGTVLTVVSSIPVAYALAKFRFRGRNLSLMLVISMMMLPPQVVDHPDVPVLGEAAGPVRHAVAADHPDGVRRRVLDLPAAPVPDDDPERVPGRGEGRRLRRPAGAPEGRPADGETGYRRGRPLPVLLRVERLLRAADLRLARTPAPGRSSYGLESFKGAHHTDWNLTMAATVLVMAPVILVFFFAQKAFVEGVTLTGVKG